MIIQHIIKSDCSFNNQVLNESNFIIKKGDYLSTYNYFNIFSPYLWVYLLNDDVTFYCNINFQGVGYAYIIGVDNNYNKVVYKRIFIQSITPSKFKIKLSNSFLYYYLKWDNSLLFIDGNYSTSLNTNNKIKICMVTTTYNRSKDINKLVSTFLSFKNTYKDNEIDLLIINNNDSSVLKNRAYDTIEEVISKNTGGSGGFIKGIQIALSSNKYSNILLCDDDAIFHPETLFRTVMLLKLRGKNDSIISGSMFEISNQSFCHCIFESLNKRGHHLNILGEININDQSQLGQIIKDMINKMNKRSENQYVAWWYCCIPCDLINQYGTPLQMFMRGDDQEYGLRLKSKIITINGIQVWHPAFSSKHSILRDYLGNRNYAIINIIHYKKYLNNIFFHFIIKFFRSINKKDSISASILALALQDCLTFNNKEIELDIILKRIEIIKKRNLFASFISIVKSLLILSVKGAKIKARLKSFISSEH